MASLNSLVTGAPSDTIKRRVYQSLSAGILSGVFDMGQKLYGGQLAGYCGVSKTPVREALTLLQQEGLVEVVPRVGYLISRVTVQDVDEIFDLRQIIEAAPWRGRPQLSPRSPWSSWSGSARATSPEIAKATASSPRPRATGGWWRWLPGCSSRCSAC
jgi:DNA-binding transcriptional MocR family regulator